MREYLAAHSNIVCFILGLIVMYIVSILRDTGPKRLNELKKGKLVFLGTVDHEKDYYYQYASVVWADKNGSPIKGELPFNIIVDRIAARQYKSGEIIYNTY